MTNLLSQISWNDLNVERIKANSFKDFHAKGLDYICLGRTDDLTVKAYFFAEGMDSQKVGEVINPHDHRYPFLTQCFSGTIRNKWYREGTKGLADWEVELLAPHCEYEQFEWRTPLNGGDGFNWVGRKFLTLHHSEDFSAGGRYFMEADELHTIQVMQPETCIVLLQFADVVPLDIPTYTYTKTVKPPTLQGLYSEFTSDEVVNRLKLLQDLTERLG